VKVLTKSLCVVSVLAIAVMAIAKDQTGADEASILVDKQSEPVASSPKLLPPANETTSSQTLPPPSISVNDAEVLPEPTAKQPFLRPAAPQRRVPATTALSVKQEPMPAPEVEVVDENAVEVRPTPPIVYDTDRDARRMYRSSGEVELVMVTQNPADGCFYEIPLCIPACCVGEPTVHSGRGLLGRGVVEYCWPSCGFRAIVKFRQIVRCDVKVEYEGD
jgi:hypothetical protein